MHPPSPGSLLILLVFFWHSMILTFLLVLDAFSFIDSFNAVLSYMDSCHSYFLYPPEFWFFFKTLKHLCHASFVFKLLSALSFKHDVSRFWEGSFLWFLLSRIIRSISPLWSLDSQIIYLPNDSSNFLYLLRSGVWCMAGLQTFM